MIILVAAPIHAPVMHLSCICQNWKVGIHLYVCMKKETCQGPLAQHVMVFLNVEHKKSMTRGLYQPNQCRNYSMSFTKKFSLPWFRIWRLNKKSMKQGKVKTTTPVACGACRNQLWSKTEQKANSGPTDRPMDWQSDLYSRVARKYKCFSSFVFTTIRFISLEPVIKPRNAAQ